ncbi:MAG: MBL fold metallo-hydrolase [Gammaproteobacteria bacterium]|nr:MAG: MBL fold metallo-hydrolase [Gammaproteobacteria bacterium]
MIQFRLLYISLLFLCSSALLAECQNKRVKVQVLGSGGPELSDGRASSSYLIWLDGDGIVLIDAGSGSSLNYEKSGAKLIDLQAFAFTHFHVDHSADFPAYIKAFYFTRRSQDLTVLGPEGNNLMPSATGFVDRMLGDKGAFPYLSDYIVANKNSPFKVLGKNVSLKAHKKQVAYRTNDFSLLAIPVHHGPIPAVAWRINIAGCAITFSGDMNNQFKTLARLAKGSDLLIAHNAIPEAQRGAGRSLHMPPSEIARIAHQAGVKKLILAHRMKRTLGKEQQTLAIIRRHYKGQVIFAEDMDIFKPNK